MSKLISMDLLRLSLLYPELLLALASFFFLSLYLRLIRGRRSSSEPVNWPIVGMLPTILSNFDSLHDYIARLAPEVGNCLMFKGPLFLGLDFFVTCDPADVCHIFTSRFHNYPKGDDFKDMLDLLGNSILSTDQEPWKIQRKMAHAVLSGRKFRSFVVDSSLKKIRLSLVPFLYDVARRGLVVDIQDVFSRYSFDMACTAVFGEDTMALSRDPPVIQFPAAMRDWEEGIHLRHAVPPCFWKLQRWLNVGSERKLSMAAKVLDRFIDEQISRRRSIHDNDLLTSYMDRPMDNDGKVKFGPNFLRDTALAFMFAGNSTITTALSWLVYLVAQHPHVERKILDELEAARPTGERPTPSQTTTVFDTDALESAVYLYATVLETLRLFPSIPLDRKGALEDDVLPSGVHIKAGTRILIGIYAMGRSRDVWGEDCMEFKPERWILRDGSIRREASYKFVTFGTGPRLCVGKEFALIQLRMVAAAVIYNFGIEVVEGQDVKPANSIILYMANGCKMRVRRRDV